ncbi:hypothetical protein Tco_0223996 [Tanacetum coccineum]
MKTKRTHVRLHSQPDAPTWVVVRWWWRGRGDGDDDVMMMWWCVVMLMIDDEMKMGVRCGWPASGGVGRSEEGNGRGGEGMVKERCVSAMVWGSVDPVMGSFWSGGKVRRKTFPATTAWWPEVADRRWWWPVNEEGERDV